MNCPDCSGQVELEIIDTMEYGETNYGVRVEIEGFYYRCPKCKQEYDEESFE